MFFSTLTWLRGASAPLFPLVAPLFTAKGVGRKFPGEEAKKKRQKIAKKIRKIALLSLFRRGRGQQKKDREIALFSLSLLYLYHV